MKKSIKLFLAAVAAAFAFSSCSSNDPAPVEHTPPPVDDGGVYSDK